MRKEQSTRVHRSAVLKEEQMNLYTLSTFDMKRSRLGFGSFEQRSKMKKKICFELCLHEMSLLLKCVEAELIQFGKHEFECFN